MINLNEFAEGALSERVNQAIAQVLENIKDPNTDFKTKRKVTVDIIFSSNEEREMSEVSVLAKAKLAPRKPVKSIILIDSDANGQVLASEFKKQIPGQQTIIVNSDGEVQEPKLEKGLQRIK